MLELFYRYSRLGGTTTFLLGIIRGQNQTFDCGKGTYTHIYIYNLFGRARSSCNGCSLISSFSFEVFYQFTIHAHDSIHSVLAFLPFLRVSRPFLLWLSSYLGSSTRLVELHHCFCNFEDNGNFIKLW